MLGRLLLGWAVPSDETPIAIGVATRIVMSNAVKRIIRCVFLCIVEIPIDTYVTRTDLSGFKCCLNDLIWDQNAFCY